MKKTASLLTSKKGFTLIELLLVIVIIGILAGIVLAIVNPAVQQRKAKESILKANGNKICLALFACAATASDATSCDTFASGEVAANVGALRDSTAAFPGNVTIAGPAANANAIPSWATYVMAIVAPTVTINSTLPGSGAANGGGGARTANACVYTCSYNFTTGSARAIAPAVAANCY